MNDYFVTRSEMDEMRDHMFTAIAKSFSDLDKKFTLLINIVNAKKNKERSKKMGDETVEELLEVLKEIASESEDKNLIYIAIELKKGFEKIQENLKRMGITFRVINKKIDEFERKL